MSEFGLNERERRLICGVLKRHPKVEAAPLFGSRAKGTQRKNSDIDLVFSGDVDLSLIARIAGELDNLPLRDPIAHTGRKFYERKKTRRI